MHLRLPVVLLSALALVGPGAMVSAKDKGKDKSKDKKENKADDRRDDRGDRRDDDDRDHHGDGPGGKVTICHVPPGNRSARHTITVGESAWSAHQGHGDHRGPCASGGTHSGRRFNDFDLNHDRVISLSEWSLDQAVFDRLDRNHNGSISRREFLRF